MNKYSEMMNKQQSAFNKLPIFYAFSDEQFKRGLQEVGANGADDVYSMGGGGYYRKADSPLIQQFLDDTNAEMQIMLDSDKTGEGFIYDMFLHELQNHEYSFTLDTTETLDALGLTISEVYSDPRLLRGLTLAKKVIELRSEN